MVIERFSSAEALGRLRAEGRRVKWPDQREPNPRMQGLIAVSSTASFEIKTHDKIFTMGSCFARNIERRLTEIGFEIPMRTADLEEILESFGHSPDYLNKYNTGAMSAEFQWALEGKLPDDETLFVETSNGVGHDLFMTSAARTKNTIGEVRAMRRSMQQGMQSIRDCRIIIVTLGMAEAWRDLKSGLHINQAPPASIAQAEPDRFVLEVMSYEEILADLEAIHAMLTKLGHPDFKMLLTVSPVPLLMTFRPMDVITANSYSKSVMRAAAEAFVFRHGNVDYFPSYEPITMSERKITYTIDNRHVQSGAVARVVDRFMSLYAPSIQFESTQEELFESDILNVADEFISAKMLVDERMYARAAVRFEQAFARDVTDDISLRANRINLEGMRILYAGCLLKTSRVDDALKQLEMVIEVPDVEAALLLKCVDLFVSAKARDRAQHALELAVQRGGDPIKIAQRRAKFEALAA